MAKTRINSRDKGNRAEREVCNTLAHYFKAKFSRRSMGNDGEDVECPYWFPFAPEVKDNKTLKLKHLWRPTQLLRSFWKQACDNAKAIGKEPLLIAKVEGLWLCWQGPAKAFPDNYSVFELNAWCELTSLNIKPVDKEL